MRFEAQTITIRDQYYVFHPLPAMVGVQIVPLIDWVRPAWVLKEHASTLQEQVEAACRQVCVEQEREEVKTATLGVAFPGNACL